MSWIAHAAMPPVWPTAALSGASKASHDLSGALIGDDGDVESRDTPPAGRDSGSSGEAGEGAARG
jgi:hypothetical protein